MKSGSDVTLEAISKRCDTCEGARINLGPVMAKRIVNGNQSGGPVLNSPALPAGSRHRPRKAASGTARPGRNLPHFAVGLVRNDIQRPIRALAHVANALLAVGEQPLFARHAAPLDSQAH